MLQFFRLSKERVRCPLIPEVVKLSKKLNRKRGTISVRYGKRMLSSPIGEGFVEVVDYDPVRNNLLFIGEEEPSVVSAIHWIILEAMEEINVIVHLHSDSKVADPLERAKEILRSVKEDTFEDETLFLGRDFVEVLRKIENKETSRKSGGKRC